MGFMNYWIKDVRINRLILLIACFGVFSFTAQITGCSWLGPRPPKSVSEIPNVDDERKSLEIVGDNVDGVSNTLEGRADRIEEGTKTVRTVLDDSGTDSSIVNEPLESIDAEANGLRKDKAELDAAVLRIGDLENSLGAEQEKIEDMTGNLGDAQAHIDALEEENNVLRDKTNQLFKEKMAWIGVVSVFGIGVSVVLIFFTRSSAATMVALGFAATLGISIAVSLYMQLIAWITISIVGVVGLGVIGYVAYRKYTENKTVDELIRTGEVTKDYLSQEAKDHIFGRGAEPGVADRIQSRPTQDMIRRVRGNGKKTFKLAQSTPMVPRAAQRPLVENSLSLEVEEKSVTY